jgi:hypothetical protein
MVLTWGQTFIFCKKGILNRTVVGGVGGHMLPEGDDRKPTRLVLNSVTLVRM